MWDENWDVIFLFQKFSSQWRFGPNGPVGLDLTIFLHELDRANMPKELYDEYVWKLNVIEAAALSEMRRHSQK